MKFLIKLLISAITLIVVSYIVPGFEFSSFGSVLVAALVLGIVNAIIKPLIVLLTLPVNILTLGVFTLVINAFMFWIVYWVVPGFNISGFATAIWGAIAYWLINWMIQLIFQEDSKI